VEIELRDRVTVTELARQVHSFYRELKTLNPEIIEDSLGKGRYSIWGAKARSTKRGACCRASIRSAASGTCTTVVAVPIGPVNVEIARRTLRGGRRARARTSSSAASGSRASRAASRPRGRGARRVRPPGTGPRRSPPARHAEARPRRR
jgi:hypothetical protein